MMAGCFQAGNGSKPGWPSIVDSAVVRVGAELTEMLRASVVGGRHLRLPGTGSEGQRH